MSAVDVPTVPSDIRLDERSFYADPWDALSRLRAAAPVSWYEPGGFWAVTRYEDIRAVNSQPTLFSNAFGLAMGDGVDAEGAAAVLSDEQLRQVRSGELTAAETRRLVSDAKMLEDGGESLGASDPPRHSQLRKLVSRAFTPRMVAGYHERIAKIVADTFRAIPIGEDIDFVEQVAVPIPALVMAEFLGVPPGDRARFVTWANSIALIIDEQDPRRQAELHEDVLQMREYARFRLEQTKLNPGDDLLSALNAVELDGERLSEANKVMFAFAFLFAGNETTRHLISGTLKALSDHPGEHAWLVADPDRSDNAIDELLRWVSPVIGLFRTATEDCEIGGQRIARHDWVYLIYASANRDESAFEWAGRLDLSRDGDHLAFGYGAHRCLGSNLARLEGRLVLRQLATDYRRFELTGPPERLSSTIFNGYSSMPARF